jgi:hypothetical protein
MAFTPSKTPLAASGKRAANRLVQAGFQPHRIAAAGDGLDVGAGDDAPFPLQAGGGEDHHMPWRTRRTLPRLRLR